MKVETSTKSRSVHGVYSNGHRHWVGDGFNVAQVIPGPANLTQLADPFLMMDYHAPYRYSPTDVPRGVGVHPHRGFETVTLAFQGSVAHHDSTGAGGVIHPGDVQWMTAASGVLHKEYHEAEWAKRGGTFHMMQLWVNLPARHKMDTPRYQGLTAGEMATVDLDGGGSATLIAGELLGHRGPASTFSPVNLWDVRLGDGESATLPIPASHNVMVFVIHGAVRTGGKDVGAEHLVVFEHDGDAITVEAATAGEHVSDGEPGARFVVLGGEPLNEPIASYGPFVMNTREQILQAIDDFNAGKFGHLDD